MGTFEVRTVVTKVHTFQEGYGAYFVPIWEGEDMSERIAEVDGGVVKIASDTTELVGNVPCVKVEDNLWVPVENFLLAPEEADDDTHDLRDRWFAEEAEAWAHVNYTIGRFQHPKPWESFVKV